MRLIRTAALAVVASMGLNANAQDGNWITVTGQVKLSEVPKFITVNLPVNVQADAAHGTSKGAVTKKNFEINKDNKGFQNVIVYLRPDSDKRDAKFEEKEIHPDLAKPKSKEHIIDQPCCQFEPRVTVARAGDTIVVKNSSPVNHNFSYNSDNNGADNPNIPPGQSYNFKKPLVFEPRYFKFSCSVHPWMGGVVQVFDHPYFALTDKNGKFEIKNAPKGKYRIVYYHEEGYHKGAAGRLGQPTEIKGGAKGTMELNPLEYEFIAPK